MEKEYVPRYENFFTEKVLYFEEPVSLEGHEIDDTQLFLEFIFRSPLILKGLRIRKGHDEILDADFKDDNYEWFELWKGRKKLCFGFWYIEAAQIKWFIEKDEVLKIKESINYL